MNAAPNLQAYRPRGAFRQKSFLRGKVRFKDARTAFDCMIRDISPKGARLDFSGTTLTPDAFDLYVSQKDQMLRASVTWRDGESVGVAFAHSTPVVDPAKAHDLSQRVSRIESEIDAFKRACRKLRASMRPVEV